MCSQLEVNPPKTKENQPSFLLLQGDKGTRQGYVLAFEWAPHLGTGQHRKHWASYSFPHSRVAPLVRVWSRLSLCESQETWARTWQCDLNTHDENDIMAVSCPTM